MVALPIYYKPDFTADDVKLDYMTSVLIAGNTGFLRIYDGADCMTVLTNDTHPLWSKVMARVCLWPSVRTRLGDTLYRRPAVALLPAPLRTVPTPRRMSINRRVAGDNGVMVTGLNGVSVLVDSPEDTPRAFRLLENMLIEPYASPNPIPTTGAVDVTYADTDPTRYMVEYRGVAVIAMANSLEDVISGLTHKPRGIRPDHVHVREVTGAEPEPKFAFKSHVRIPLGQRVAKVEAISYRMGATPADDCYWYAVELLPGCGRKWYREDELKGL